MLGHTSNLIPSNPSIVKKVGQINQIRTIANKRQTEFSSTADAEGDGLLDGGPALDALLHDDGAALASHHVQARLEQHRRG